MHQIIVNIKRFSHPRKTERWRDTVYGFVLRATAIFSWFLFDNCFINLRIRCLKNANNWFRLISRLCCKHLYISGLTFIRIFLCFPSVCFALLFSTSPLNSLFICPPYTWGNCGRVTIATQSLAPTGPSLSRTVLCKAL